jgi:rare lipoprotein A
LAIPSQKRKLIESESNFGTGDYLILTNEIRLAGCSLVALAMMSVPGLGTHGFETTSQQPIETPASMQPQAAAVISPPKKRPSFLKRIASNVGHASWYGAVLNGHKTASGETFDMNQMTACHRTLPFGTMVKVVDTHSGKSVIVRINDRGVLFADRIIDLSRGAADRLGIRKIGVANVRLEVLNKKQAAQAVQEEVASLKADSSVNGQSESENR